MADQLIYTNQDIYNIFRRCQGKTRNSGYRLPKNWEEHYNNKMSKENKEQLDKLTLFLNTKWNNIDPERYLSLGFELYGMRFTYRKFLDRKVLLHYIQQDKLTKREVGMVQEEIKSSVSFVKQYINGSSRGSKLLRYCNEKDGMFGVPVKHYLNNKITKSFMIILIWYGYYTPTQEELNLMPYVNAHYREVANKFDDSIRELLRDIM